jgi:hypothetical protein
MPSLSLILAAFSLAVVIVLVTRKSPSEEQEKENGLLLQEPPVVYARIRDFLIGGTGILDKLAIEHMHKFPHGIFTVKFVGWKIYVVNDPHLTTVIQARSKHTGLG